MFLLLILLVSPAFGRPSSGQPDVGAEVANQLLIFTNFNNETGKLFLNSSVVENVVKTILEAERNILEMQAKLKTLEIEQIQFAENYFEAFNQAKSYLRQTRQGLRKLADKTVKDVRDLKIVLGGLDKTNGLIFLKIFINRMKDLMVETLESLEEAKEKYNSAVETFENLNSSIKAQNLQILDEKESQDAEREKLQQKHSQCFRDWCGEEWLIFPFPCLFGCVPIDPSFDPSIEYENLKTITERMLESGNNFDQAIKVAIRILTKEIELITVWNKSAKVVSKNIDEYPAEFLKKYKSVRNIFISGLDDLNDAAENFLKQPKDILKLNKK